MLGAVLVLPHYRVVHTFFFHHLFLTVLILYGAI